MGDEDALRLRMNQRLAEQLGAKTVTLYGGDITRQIAEYARISGVSKIVLGRSYTKKKLFSQNVNFADQLTALVPRMEIYLIPDTYTRPYAKKNRLESIIAVKDKNYLKDSLAMLAVLGISTILAFLFRLLGINEANIVRFYRFLLRRYRKS